MDDLYFKRQVLLMELRVEDVMLTNIVTVTPETKMSELRSILRDKKISGAPVVKDNELVGIISIEDLISWLSDGGADINVSDKMTRKVEYVYSDQPLISVIKMIEKFGYGRFPVVDRNTQNLVGILTKGNIIEGTLKKLEQDFQEEEIRQYRASHIFEDITAEYKEIFLTYKVKSGDFDHGGQAATQMKKNLKRLGLMPDVIKRLAIVSYEAEMNVVMYARKAKMTFQVTPQVIKIFVSDEGPGIPDIERAMREGYSTATIEIREMGFGAGMGLPNIKRNSDEFTIESEVGKGTQLGITINIS